MDKLIMRLIRFIPNFIRTFGVILFTGTATLWIFLSFATKSFDKDDAQNSGWISALLLLDSFEEQFFDWRSTSDFTKDLIYVNSDKPLYVDNPVLIEIDDESLSYYQEWPLRRSVYKRMLEQLDERGSKVVAFDVLFPEESLSCDEAGNTDDDRLATTLAEIQAKPDRNIILAYTADKDGPLVPAEEKQEPPMDMLNSMISVENLQEYYDPEKEKITKNDTELDFHYLAEHNFLIEKFYTTGIDFGFINNEEDFDGVYRHFTLFKRTLSKDLEGSLFLPALGFRAYLSSLPLVDLKVAMNRNGSSTLLIKDDSGEKSVPKSIYVNEKGSVKIQWKGGIGYYPSISLAQLNDAKPGDKLENKHLMALYKEGQQRLKNLKPEDENYEQRKANLEKSLAEIEPHLYVDLTDKIVFVGSTAVGAHDLRNSPINPTIPGVYAHMNVTRMFIENSFFKQPAVTKKYSFYLLFGAVVILLVLMLFNIAVLDVLGLAILLLGTVVIDLNYFLTQGYEIKLGGVWFGLIGNYVWITILNFTQASAEKKQIKGAFSRYVAPAIVDDMLENPDKLKVGGERKDITCLFSDVRDFTSISEQLTPTELAAALNRYMGEMTDIVFETNGTLDKYIGDAIVAFWGAPVDIGDHVNQAMDGAVKMLEALPAINEEFKAKNLPEFKIGLGLNSGECSVGNMGSDAIFAYTALGDNMNLGARLESLCKHYGAQILVSEFTFERMDRERFQARCIDKVRVKGKTEPVGVYEVLYSYHPLKINENSFRTFNQGYELFLKGKFAQAKSHFEEVLEKVPTDKASQRLKDSCDLWLENPPGEEDDWTITTMTTK